MKRIVILLALVLVLGACASSPRVSDADNLALHRTNAGEPVPDFQYLGSLSGWSPLGDRALVVWTRPSQAYLLELMGPCTDLDYAPAISLTNSIGRVSARFDSVNVLGGPGSTLRIPCRIETIRPLDVPALKQARQEMREARVVEREPSGG